MVGGEDERAAAVALTQEFVGVASQTTATSSLA